MTERKRVRIRLTSAHNSSITVNGTVDEIIDMMDGEKFIKINSLGDQNREMYLNTDLVAMVEAV